MQCSRALMQLLRIIAEQSIYYSLVDEWSFGNFLLTMFETAEFLFAGDN